jgi:SWI/SNF-related matrix-associated actin-dependent regulator of chromatin subfamily A member 5
LKSDAETRLLPKKEIHLYVGMTSMQREWYARLLRRDGRTIKGITGRDSARSLNNII